MAAAGDKGTIFRHFPDLTGKRWRTLRPARQSDRTRPDISASKDRFMTDHISPLDQARILSEALPHMQQYDEETIVIKYGGHAMGAEETAKAFARDIVLLEQTAINPVVVHGGGPQIATMLKRLGIQSEFAAGLRITDAATIEIVEMVLAGSVNKQLVGYINEAGGKAVGLCGKDGNMVKASKTTRTMVDPDSNIEKAIDLGFVGDPDKVDLTLLNQLIGYELIPVLAPLATSHDGQTLNVNADTFAGAVAGALKAKRLLLLTDVPGVLDKSKKLIPELSVKDARKLIADGTISGGMIPKVETCIYALEQGGRRRRSVGRCAAERGCQSLNRARPRGAVARERAHRARVGGGVRAADARPHGARRAARADRRGEPRRARRDPAHGALFLAGPGARRRKRREPGRVSRTAS